MNIPSRTLLVKLYSVQKLSVEVIAKLINARKTTVKKYLRRYKIRRVKPRVTKLRFKGSRLEYIIYQKLKTKFKKVIRQYKSEEYPFHCDFYVPEIKLYIEIQGHWTHGKQPYRNNIKCNMILDEWISKAKYSNYFKSAINTWTKRDVLKRSIAINNKLNWIEFFSEKEFNDWFKNF